MASGDALNELMCDWSQLVDRALDYYLGDRLDCPPRLKEAMRYSVFAGGKRLRPLLVLLAADACRGAIDAAMPAACAVEMVHTYSLIHDDLPAMDDDELRRGQPTCHRRFDEATAILAGDGLLTLAFETVCELQPYLLAVRCAKELAKASGAAGMVGGQMDDLRSETAPAAEPKSNKAAQDWLESVHRRKTGALLAACLKLGGIVAGANEEKLAAVGEYGRRIGLAFQVTDDVLDACGEASKLGKNVRKDVTAGKRTYPGLLGVEESRRYAKTLVDQAKDSLRPLGTAGRRLAALADFIVERDC